MIYDPKKLSELKPKLSQIKAILLDIDGTLTNSQMEVTARTFRVLEEAIEQGFKVSLCTGRSYPMIYNYFLSKFPQESLHIVNDGGTIITADGDIQHEVPIESRKVEVICQQVVEWGGNFSFGQTDYHIYSPQLLKDRIEIDLWQGRVTSPQGLSDWQTTAMCLYHIPDDINQFVEDLDPNLLVFPNDSNTMHGTYYRVAYPEANKRTALDKWVELNNLDMSEILFIGDSYNDLDLMGLVGVGLAVANGKPEVKDKADLVIESNDQQGPVNFIQRYLF